MHVPVFLDVMVYLDKEHHVPLQLLNALVSQNRSHFSGMARISHRNWDAARSGTVWILRSVSLVNPLHFRIRSALKLSWDPTRQSNYARRDSICSRKGCGTSFYLGKFQTTWAGFMQCWASTSLKASQNNLASCLARPLWSKKGHHSQTGPQSIYCPQQKMQKGSLFHPLASQACNWRPIEGNWHLETYTSSLRCLLFKATTNQDVRPRIRNTPTTSTLQCVQRAREREREREIFHIIINIYIYHISGYILCMILIYSVWICIQSQEV